MGAGWTWHSKWINGTSITGDQWNSVGVTLPALASPLQRIGLQLTGKSTSTTKIDTLYVDDIAVMRAVDATLVTQWGEDGLGYAWKLLNDASTAPGDAGIAGTQPMATNGSSLYGGFDTLKPTMDKAVVVSGQMEFVGSPGASYTALRYAITYLDSATLTNPLTDSARWVSPKKYYGYEFTPRSGGTDQPNGGGGVGSVWSIKNGNWPSTYSNGGGPVGPVVNQAPRLAEIDAGKYNWAISVQQVNDTTNEVRWYVEKVHAAGVQATYWFGGTVMAPAVTDKFNGIGFWTKDGAQTQFNLTGVKAELGNPITVPEAPWQAYYIDQWGEDGLGYAWKVLNDSNTVVGDAGIAGTQPMATNGSSLYGGFGQDIAIPTGKALKVSGQMEFVGSPGESYTALRYAITYLDSAKLNNPLTDSARWTSPKKYYGYEFTPRSGGTDQPNGGGGVGSVWSIINGNWSSTYSNGGGPVGPVVNQAPRLAVIDAGTYNWAISVQQVNDTTNEVRWYIEKTHAAGVQATYWFGGTVMARAVTNKLNGIGFWTKDGAQTQFNIIGAKIDIGDPITIPEAPWQAYYIDQWGEDGLGFAWKVLNDSNTVVGDAGIAGTQPMATNGSSLYGGFGQDIPIRTDKAVKLSGQMEFVGSPGASYTALRYAITYLDSAKLNNPLTDSARWTSPKKYYGYEFTPRSGGTDQPNGGGGVGSVWSIKNGNWTSTYSNGGGPVGPVVNQAPRLAEIDAGKYNWAVSVQQVNDTTDEVRWYIEKVHAAGVQTTYWFGGTVMAPAVTNKLNGIGFWTKDGAHTQFNIIGAKIDIGDPIIIPEAPFQAYYVDKWGFFGGKMGGWSFTPGEVFGNATISGNAPNTDWAVLRGEFQTYTPTAAKPLKISGKVEFVGGGFAKSGSFRFGVFNTDSAKTYILDTTTATLPDSTRWTGTDNHSTGYLFIPQSGSNGAVTWGGGTGTWGGIMDNVWLSPEGSNNYALGSKTPDPSTSGAGIYDFNVSITPMSTGGQLVKFNFIKEDGKYALAAEATDTHSLSKFNSIAFALDAGNSITAMNITDVQIDTGTISGVDNLNGTDGLPTVYSLSQNYPNPFNPTTTIKFGIPQAGDVSLVVYDILGRKVAELLHGNLAAGYHTVNFNASNLASGVYFYRIEAGNFVSVKKLMLLK